MITLKFNNEFMDLNFRNIKDAYKYFMSNSRFWIHKHLAHYFECNVYINDIRKYYWIYCQELSPDFDLYNDIEYYISQLIYCPGNYCFVSLEV